MDNPAPTPPLLQQPATLWLSSASSLALLLVYATGFHPATIVYQLIDRIRGVYELFCQAHFPPQHHPHNIHPLHNIHTHTLAPHPPLKHPLPTNPSTLASSLHHPRSPHLIPSPSTPTAAHYPGLINSSANLCFINAVLQSLASMPHVIAYLNLIHSYAHPEAHLVNALRDILLALNTPRDRRMVLRPIAVAQALLNHAAGRGSSLFNSEQQDAQEFFVTVVDALEAEASVLADELKFEHETSSIDANPWLRPPPSARADHQSERERIVERNRFLEESRQIRRSPFRGLMAHRIACRTCGYASAVRHSPADHFSLNVPPKMTCRLEECLEDYTKLELLEDYTCRKCSLIATHQKLTKQYETTQDQQSDSARGTTLTAPEVVGKCSKMSISQKKRLQVLKKQIALVQMVIVKEPEQELPSQIVLSRTASLAATKQTMFARPPASLTIHLSRSTAFARGMSLKNHCQVIYPEVLDIAPFCTGAQLSGRAKRLDSSGVGESGEAVESADGGLKCLYKLSSVVVHFGSHSFGHYITFRRVVCGLGGGDGVSSGGGWSEQWFRISDENVQVSSLDEALRSNPFLVMYERIDDDPRHHHHLSHPEGPQRRPHSRGESGVNGAPNTMATNSPPEACVDNHGNVTDDPPAPAPAAASSAFVGRELSWFNLLPNPQFKE